MVIFSRALHVLFELLIEPVCSFTAKFSNVLDYSERFTYESVFPYSTFLVDDSTVSPISIFNAQKSIGATQGCFIAEFLIQIEIHSQSVLLRWKESKITAELINSTTPVSTISPKDDDLIRILRDHNIEIRVEDHDGHVGSLSGEFAADGVVSGGVVVFRASSPDGCWKGYELW